jgi:hypothetical protein
MLRKSLAIWGAAESSTDARQKHLAALQNLWAAHWVPDAEAP